MEKFLKTKQKQSFLGDNDINLFLANKVSGEKTCVEIPITCQMVRQEQFYTH